MAWSRKQFRPIDVGGGGGGFAPSPGFPPRGPRPPGAVPAGAGRPRKFTYPQFPRGQRSRPMSQSAQRQMERKSKTFLKQMEWYFGTETSTVPVSNPDSPEAVDANVPVGYFVQCTAPAGCSGSLMQWRYLATTSTVGNLICGLADPKCANTPLNQSWATVQGLANAPQVIIGGMHRAAFTDNNRFVWRRIGTAGETPWPQVMTKTVTVGKTMFFPDTLAPPDSETLTRTYSIGKTKPITDVIMGDGLPPGGVSGPYPHTPPPKGTTEKKYRIVPGKLGKAYGAATEFRDFLDCMAKNIPGEPCKGVKNQLHLYAACVAKHHNSVNMPEAIACFYGQQGQDAAYGLPDRMGRPSDNPFYQRPVGPTSGFWSQPGAPSMTKI